MELKTVKKEGFLDYRWVCAAALGVAVWLLPFDRGLSTSEAVTAWFSTSGMRHALVSSADFGHTSPLYYLLLAIISLQTGASEIALRLLSIGATVLVLALGFYSLRRSQRTFFVAVALVAANYESVGVLLSAFPASLGLLFAVGATLCWARLVEKRSFKLMIPHIGCAVIAVYAWYPILIPLSVAHLLLWLIAPRAARFRWRASLGYLSVTLVFITPAIMHLTELVLRTGFGGGALRLGMDSLQPVGVTVYGLCVAVLVAGFAALRDVSTGERQGSDLRTDRRIFIVGLGFWISAVSLGLLGNPALSGDGALPSVGWVGLSLALAASRVFSQTTDQSNADRTSLYAGAVSLIAAVLAQPPVAGWRETADFLKKNGERYKTVVIMTGSAEAEDLSFYRGKDSGKYLSAPFVYYPIPQRVIPAGASNLELSVEPPTFSGLLVYTGVTPVLSQAWSANTPLSFPFEEPKLIEFVGDALGQEVDDGTHASEATQLEGGTHNDPSAIELGDIVPTLGGGGSE
jgi:hypothetical protein